MYEFDFAALRPEQLARILDGNPARNYVFGTEGWTAEQSVVLATWPNPLKIHLIKTWDCKVGFQFEDGGTAFVNALAERHSSFGSLWIAFETLETPFSYDNLKRLFKVEVPFEKLKICFLARKYVLLPFSANAKALNYQICLALLRLKTSDSLDITASDLTLKIYLDGFGPRNKRC